MNIILINRRGKKTSELQTLAFKSLGNNPGNIEGSVLTVTFPHSAVLFLRCSASTPDKLKIRMLTPGGEISYEIPVMKSQKYTIEDIFGKKLLFLIPFYIFCYENRFEEYNQDKAKMELLKQEYEQIKNRLEELANQGEIDEYTKCTIMDMSNKVLEHIARKYENVKKRVKSVMGGKVLDYEAKAIRNEGIHKGRLEMLMVLVRDGLLSVKEAASRANLTEEAFQKSMQDYRR